MKIQMEKLIVPNENYLELSKKKYIEYNFI